VTRRLTLALLVALGTLAFVGLRASSDRREAPAGVWSDGAWLSMASPGPLSEAHAFLTANCVACHAPIGASDAANCIACHADNETLLQRQPTAFHAAVDRCADCHVEHGGRGRRPTEMRHEVLTAVALRLLDAADDGTRSPIEELRWRVVQTIAERRGVQVDSSASLGVTPPEAVLLCTSCHGNQDRHVGYFGVRCEQCHSTASWTIVGFQHPSPRSRECEQCHRAPPSHYMEHFSMVSMRAARQTEARVEQCYLCHQTTAWNDIVGVGRYKHH